MASLNLSTNGTSITKSYQSVLNAPLPSGAADGHWAIYTVQAPLVNAFQGDGGKESVMKVQSTGEGELVDFVEQFSDGRIQFGFLRIIDPNTTLPKCVLVGWCGEGVPERTKGYFTSHMNAVSKLLQGYHIQITARSDNDLAPERIIQKVADASGSKYSGDSAGLSAQAPRQTMGSKPAFLPTRVGSGSSGFNPLGSRTRQPQSEASVDEDGWGADAPQLTRTQLEKVASAYQPTKVNLAELVSKPRYQASNSGASDVVRGVYQPVGKVDLAEIRRQARESGKEQDNRPTPVKGSYEPVGKVDIAAIRARAQPPSRNSPPPRPENEEEEQKPQSLSERSSAFQQSERLTSLPKPKFANKNVGGILFAGTKAPVPMGFAPKENAGAAPVGSASRTFADKGGKTPAQLWAEKKAKQGASTISPAGIGSLGTTPLPTQQSGNGGWKSGYAGKSWAPVQTTRTGQSVASNVSEQRTGNDASVEEVGDRLAAAPPPMDRSSKPDVGSQFVPPPPAEEVEEGAEDETRPSSPIRVALPVGRTREPEEEPPLLVESVSRAATNAREVSPEPKIEADEPGRGAATALADSSFGPGTSSAVQASDKAGKRALVQYDYEKAEDNEIELKEGEYVTNIEMVDEDWWMGQNADGESGLFPANYVEIVDDGEEPAPVPTSASAPAAVASPAGPQTPKVSQKATATAQYDYEAAEDNELSFPDGAKITNVEFPDDDWWLGEYHGRSGLFPANYVVLDE